MKVRERAVVLSQESLDRDIFSLWLRTEHIAAEAVPGQFVTLYSEDRTRLLPRPLSICEAEPESGALRLVYRAVGEGTREFSRLTEGERLDVLGPLGNGFPLTEGKSLIVGGGIGVPPLLWLARALPGEKILVMGYRSRTYLEEELRAAAPLFLATEDGSRGTCGTVLDVLRERDLSADTVYACGPSAMLRALKEWAGEEHRKLWVSLEERMACGIGACLSCVCPTVQTDAHTKVRNRRICAEGPVFDAGEVIL